jgi:2'-5' RNA ligase
MNPLPAQFTNRWQGNRPRLSYEDAVCWHLLLGGHARVRATAVGARQRLARFAGWHMTPLQWLHVTVLRVGTVDRITEGDMEQMLTRAQAALARTPPVTVTLERVVYHPEAIALSVSPTSALDPVLTAARAATRQALGAGAPKDGGHGKTWAPHLTLCYSTTEQAAAPVIAELGRTVPACEATIGEMSLVVQNGPEHIWDWRIAGSVRLLGEPGPAQRQEALQRGVSNIVLD